MGSQVDLASGHSRPVRFDPEPGRILAEAPAAITGWFSSDIRNEPASFIQVLDDGGNRIETDGTLLSRDRRSMSVELPQGLGDGAYVVHWSTFDDADGDIITGCYVFFVGQASADEAIQRGSALDGGAACPANSPINHATLALEVETSGANATVTMLSENFTVRPPSGTSVVADAGHYHIYLNQAPLDVLAGHAHDHDHDQSGQAGSGGGHDHHGGSGPTSTTVHWYEETYTFEGLPPGQHTVTVVLVHDDHTTPLMPPVFASKTFTIGGSSGGGSPTWLLLVGVTLALGVGLTLGRRFSGPQG